MENVTLLELFGTEEVALERRSLTAGPLTAIFEEGNLRDIRFDGVEVVRAINYLARDVSWGTYKPVIRDVTIEESDQGFDIGYRAVCGAGTDNELRYSMHISASVDGLSMRADAEAITDFHTNRTGFVILHAAGVAGSELLVGHSDGNFEETSFPRLIKADQPAFDIVALTHHPAPGLRCVVEMKGEAFEMEDQRNWSDASFKTYVRPLSQPRPYAIAKGARDIQSISVRLEGELPGRVPQASRNVTMRLGEIVGRMPATALFVDETVPPGSSLAHDFTYDLIVRVDPSGNAADLSRALQTAKSSAGKIAIELVLDARDAIAEAAMALDLIRHAGNLPFALLVSPRRDFRTRSGGMVPEGEVPIGELVSALRAAGFTGLIGAGTPSNFAEFNRNPPTAECDFVYFSVAAIVHAADDQSVVETLDVYPMLLESAASLCPGKPIWLLPCTIGVRYNPYGETVQPNPRRTRVPAARCDPRHVALFGAAFAVGVAARVRSPAVDRLVLGSPWGPFACADAGGVPYPIGLIQHELAAAAGAERLAVRMDGTGISALAYLGKDGRRALIANLSQDPIEVSLPPVFEFAEVIKTDADIDRLQLISEKLTLGPYRSAVLIERKA